MNRCTALFCSLFLPMVLILLSPFSTRAEEEPLEVKDVVVSSTRLPDVPVDARTIPAKVTIITTDDIKKTGARTVQEAIQWATGIVMYDSVGNAFQQTIDLRGFNGQPVPATTVFVDGVRVNEPDFNTVNFDLIPFDTIERIEIIPGASAIYGKNAMGGVINIITKRGGEKHSVTGEGLWGSFSRQRYTINANGPIGKFDYYTNFSREMEEGYRTESAARISRFSGKLGYRPMPGLDLTLAYTYVKDRLQQAGSLPISQASVDPTVNFTPGDYFASDSHLVRFTGRQALPLGFSLNVNGFYRRLDQDQFTVSQPFFPGGALPQATNITLTDAKGGTAQLTNETGFGSHRNTLVMGAEFTRNDFGNRRHSVVGNFAFSGVGSNDEDVLGAYVQNTLNLASVFVVTGGVRYDYDRIDFTDDLNPSNSGNKRFSRVTPRAGLTYFVTPQTSLYFSYGEAFRTPTYNELFALGSFGSNSNLKPVHSRNYEVGIKSALGAWGEATIAAYRTDVKDEILIVCGDPFTCGATTFASNQNIDRSQRRGIETTVKARYNQYFDGMVNYTYTEATIESNLTLNPFYFDAFGGTPYVQQVRKGSTFSLVPKHRIGVTGNFHPAEGWTLSLMGLYVSSQFLTNDEQNTQPQISNYFLLNGRASYERSVPGGRLSGFVMLNNILDQRYFTQGIIAPNNLTGGGNVERFVVPAPSISVYGGLSYRFDALSQ